MASGAKIAITQWSNSKSPPPEISAHCQTELAPKRTVGPINRFRRIGFAVLLLCAAHARSETFHFAILGDRTGRAVPGVYEQAWREIAATHPDFVVTVGDAIEGWNDHARVEWDAVKRNWLNNVPVYHTAGNHDVWDDASERLFTQETGRPTFYSFGFKTAHFVVLDNSRTEGLSAPQIAFLQSNLTKNRAGGPTFVFFHRPFWLIPLKLHAPGFALHKIAAQFNVCCVISGHGHQFQSVAQDGIAYLEVGSSGASLAGAGPAGIGYEDGWFYQYVYVTVEGKSVTFEVRELGPPFGLARVHKIQAGAP